MFNFRFWAISVAVLFGMSANLYAQDKDEKAPAYPSMTCEKDADLDSCWKTAAEHRESDPAQALFYFEQSCEFGHHPWGCYEAGKLYLHNSDLRDYTKASVRFETVCKSDAVGVGPYACKFLGWMHTAGIGMDKDQKTAANLLSKACFSHNILTTDPEGCTLLADGLLQGQFDSIINAEKLREAERPKYLAYLAYSRACLDGAKDICEKANELLVLEQSAKAGWVEVCSYLAPAGYTCADLAIEGRAYEQNRMAERNLISQFAKFKH